MKAIDYFLQIIVVVVAFMALSVGILVLIDEVNNCENCADKTGRTYLRTITPQCNGKTLMIEAQPDRTIIYCADGVMQRTHGGEK